MKPLDWMLAALIVLLLGLAVRRVRRGRKSGSACPGCGGDCASCGMKRG